MNETDLELLQLARAAVVAHNGMVARLDEATALRALASRAPAQPAAPEPETPEQVCERLGIDVPTWAADLIARAKVTAAQPAAPAYTGASAYADMVQPATPEPSADLDWAAMYAKCEAELTATQESAFKHAARAETAEARLAALRGQQDLWLVGARRLDAAEAQLAAVTEALSMPGYYVKKDPDDLLGSEIAEMQSCLSEAFELLTHSGGTGEKP